MADYISRQEAIEAIKQPHGGCYTEEAKEFAVYQVLSVPTADVVERKRGKWVSSRPDAPMFGYHYCSLCGRKRTSPKDHYCPDRGSARL